jgi:hypothetical protein
LWQLNSDIAWNSEEDDEELDVKEEDGDDDDSEEIGENCEAYCRIVMVVTRSYLTMYRHNYVHKVLFEQTRFS